MKLITNVDGTVIGYQIIGGEETQGIEYDGSLPKDFFEHFGDGYYRVIDGKIQINDDYLPPAEPAITVPSQSETATAYLAKQVATLTLSNAALAKQVATLLAADAKKEAE